MRELRDIDEGPISRISECCRGDFDNGEWLSEELEQMGERFDRLEDTESDE